MTEITVVRGKNGLIGMYKDGYLACTQDKHTKPDELEMAIFMHGGAGCTVKEKEGDFKVYAEIPVQLGKPETSPAGVLRAAQEVADAEAKVKQDAVDLAHTVVKQAAEKITKPAEPAKPVEVKVAEPVKVDPDIGKVSELTEAKKPGKMAHSPRAG